MVLVGDYEDKGCLHLSPTWWWQKGEEDLQDCNLKILDDMHGRGWRIKKKWNEKGWKEIGLQLFNFRAETVLELMYAIIN